MEPQISVEKVIQKLTEQIANQSVRIATLEAYVDQLTTPQQVEPDYGDAFQDQSMLPDSGEKSNG